MNSNEENSGVHLEGFAFGMTDGIICFLGIIIGVAQATQNVTLVVIAGIVGGVADAFGNSIGFFISQLTEQSVQTHQKETLGMEVRVHTFNEVAMSGIFSFLATIIALIVLIGPFLIIKDFLTAMLVTFFMGILALFLLGIFVAKYSQKNKIMMGLIYSCIGIAGTFLSYLLGSILNQIFAV